MPRKKIHEDRNEYKNNFAKENYDRVNLLIPKGQKKQLQDIVKNFSPKISVNKYINMLIEEDLNRRGLL